MIGVLDEVSERKAAEIKRTRLAEALREKASKFETLAENVSQLAWMAEPDGHIF